MRVLDLFAGIGGFSLGLQRAGMEIVGQCEIEPFCLAVLAKHWPNVWRFNDVRKLTGELVREHCGHVDLICGGFPCQDISSAGDGVGLSGARSGLWFEMLRIIQEVGPAWCLIENVPALRSRGADTVLAGLEAAGYSARVVVVGAWAVRAPHKRDRAWIVAYRDNDGRGGIHGEAGRREDGPQQWAHVAGESVKGAGLGDADGLRELQSGGSESDQRGRTCDDGEGVADASRDEQRRQGEAERADGERVGEHGDADLADSEGSGREGSESAGSGSTGGRTGEHGHLWPSGPGEEQHEWEAPRLVKFPLGGELNGLPVRLLRFANRSTLKAYGNSIIPQIPEIIGRWIMQQPSHPPKSPQ